MSRRNSQNRNRQVNNNNTKEVVYMKPLNGGQEDLVAAIAENTIVLVCGPAGCGKSYCSVTMACQYLAEGKVKKILLTRPIVASSAKKVGALPGDIKEKTDPYLRAVMEQMKKYYPATEVSRMIRDGIIETSTLELMQGLTFDDCFMILDEAQNCDFEELTMFLTRLGKNSKIVLNGDVNQSFLKKDSGAFAEYLELLDGIPNIEIVELLEEDIVRNPIIKDILRAVARRKS